LNAANIAPHPKPVSIDNVISFITYSFRHSDRYIFLRIDY
jgi:hypothetical protein